MTERATASRRRSVERPRARRSAHDLDLSRVHAHAHAEPELCRGGFEDVAFEVQRLWVAGKRDEAVTRVPDERVELVREESRRAE